jgi:hypothetical protein
VLKQFDDSISELKRSFQDIYDQTYQDIEQQKSQFKFNSFFDNNKDTKNAFDFSNLFDFSSFDNENLQEFTSNFFQKKKQQHCKMVPRKRGNTVTMVNECI